jgi:hypothetical protein
MKVENTIAAIAAIAGLALAGCHSKSKDTSGKAEDRSPDFSDVKNETGEAHKTTGEFIEDKAEQGGKAIVGAGEKAADAVKETIDKLQDQSKDTMAPEPGPEPDPKSGDQ